MDSIGHLDKDTGMAGLVGLPGVIPQVDRCAFPECLQEAGGGKVTCTVEERKHSFARCERTALGTLERSCLKGIACAGARAVRVLFLIGDLPSTQATGQECRPRTVVGVGFAFW